MTQAKWNIRMMLADLGHDIECSILGIINMNYPKTGPIRRLNVKGIIESDSTKKALLPRWLTTPCKTLLPFLIIR
ncbi:MAG: hypothetical protein SGI83_07215 [Bacteroidota bacterium]|nr:hypothetical protein [Bacteroidota bacterium]